MISQMHDWHSYLELAPQQPNGYDNGHAGQQYQRFQEDPYRQPQQIEPQVQILNRMYQGILNLFKIMQNVCELNRRFIFCKCIVDNN